MIQTITSCLYGIVDLVIQMPIAQNALPPLLSSVLWQYGHIKISIEAWQIHPLIQRKRDTFIVSSLGPLKLTRSQ